MTRKLLFFVFSLRSLIFIIQHWLCALKEENRCTAKEFIWILIEVQIQDSVFKAYTSVNVFPFAFYFKDKRRNYFLKNILWFLETDFHYCDFFFPIYGHLVSFSLFLRQNSSKTVCCQHLIFLKFKMQGFLFDRTGQDRTGQDRTGQDRTGQDRIEILLWPKCCL